MTTTGTHFFGLPAKYKSYSQRLKSLKLKPEAKKSCPKKLRPKKTGSFSLPLSSLYRYIHERAWSMLKKINISRSDILKHKIFIHLVIFRVMFVEEG